MRKILGISKEQALQLRPSSFMDSLMSAEEFIYLAELFDAFWQYDYEAALAGRPGKHALLKSGLHSDGFFVSKILLAPRNIRMIMATQMMNAFDLFGLALFPNKICGIPDGATGLAEDYISLMRLPDTSRVVMEKVNGKITLVSGINQGDKVLMLEDFCTRGTGFIEAVTENHDKQPGAKILPLELVMLNRGGMKEIFVPGVGTFVIVSIVDYRINEWEAALCPLCLKYGSVAIKPKESETSWTDITTAQIAA